MILLLCLLTATGLQMAQALLRITVTDPSGGVLVGAHVHIADGDRVVADALTDSRGEALFEHVPPGRYVLRVESPGFEVQALADVRLRAGQNRRTVQLSIARFTQAITVNRDPRVRASDPRGDAFATQLGPDQIDQLPDDPTKWRACCSTWPGRALRSASTAFDRRGFPRRIRCSTCDFAARRLPPTRTKPAACSSIS